MSVLELDDELEEPLDLPPELALDGFAPALGKSMLSAFMIASPRPVKAAHSNSIPSANSANPSTRLGFLLHEEVPREHEQQRAQ